MTDKLIIFDYSGTLSLDMAAFANPDNLIRHLKNSGLYALGIGSELFWEIVNDTWIKGSTTQLGYKNVMQERILDLLPEISESIQPEVSGAVSNFVDAYLDHSRIDEHWLPVLKKLSENKAVQVIIATDHYAEATNAIIKFLSETDIKAASLKDRGGQFIVANSADIGLHKAQKRFWEMVKGGLQPGIRRVLLIDDFGQNEQQNNDYSDADKINDRRKRTIEIMYDIFHADVELFSFSASDKTQNELMAEASAAINRFLH